MQEFFEVCSFDPAKTQDGFGALGAKLELQKQDIIFFLAKQWRGRNYTNVEKDIGTVHAKRPFDAYLVETNSAGHHVVDVLRTVYNVPIIPVATTPKMEHPSKHPNSMDKVETVRWAMQYKQEGHIKFPDPKVYPIFNEVIRQIENYESHITKTGKESFSAPEGDHDDFVSCFLLICWYARKRFFGVQRSTYTSMSKKFNYNNKDDIPSSLTRNQILVRRNVVYPS